MRPTIIHRRPSWPHRPAEPGSPTRGTTVSGLSAAHSAVNFGHHNDEIIATAHRQLDDLTLVSRAFHSDRLGPLLRHAGCAVRQGHGAAHEQRRRSRRERNQGRTQMGHRRRWVPEGSANIVVAANNFHGRTITIVSFSSDDSARTGFGPFTPGFRTTPSATPTQSRRRSTRTPSPSSWSRSRARPESSCRRTTTCPDCDRSAVATTCC